MFLFVASAFMPRIREGRSVQIDSLCDFGNVDQQQKVIFNVNELFYYYYCANRVETEAFLLSCSTSVPFTLSISGGSINQSYPN